jgi:hypothetical protein
VCVRAITLRRKIWTGYVVLTGPMRSSYEVVVKEPEGKTLLGIIGIDRRILLK